MKGLRFFRQRAGLTQAELAEALGVSRASVNAWENCQTYPNAGLLPEMADLLLCSIDELYHEQAEPDEEASA